VRRLLISAASMTVAALLLAPAASAVDEVNTQRLRNGVSSAGILEHMRTLQRLANANDGNRAAATPGYEASLDFVERRMTRAGYEVERKPFTYASWEQLGPATLQREGQDPYLEPTDEDAGDYAVAQYSGSGAVTAPVVTTNDIVLTPQGEQGSGTSGCQEADWADQVLTGKIALVERGGCNYVVKVALAQRLGAVAVLIFNDGYPGRSDPAGILLDPFTTIPVAGLSYAAGSALYTAVQSGPVNVTFNVQTFTENITQDNLIADTATGDPERTIVVGAHLDSVEEGPGINDNGSGSATILKIAEEIADLPRNPRNRIRFAWWAAEESGLNGSTAYVDDLIESGEIDDIEANLNFDMMASPNFVRFVYDGDNSTGEGAPGPLGSAEIEQVFLDYFDSVGLETEPTAFDGRSDYGPFIAPEAYVAAGGLFSGAEGVKTAEEEAIYGGAAGSWYDPCYHQFCDSFSTVVYEPPFDPDADPPEVSDGLEAGSEAADAAQMRGNGPIGLGQLADGAADATWTLARSQSPLVGPAAAQTARVGGSARKRYRKAYRRAAKHRVYKGGQVIR
jgi:Zn-dependent M28 family amino/carboxypeptidase